jgi:hypothetical protein
MGAKRRSADPRGRPNQECGPSTPCSALRSTRSSSMQNGKGGRAHSYQRPTMGVLSPKKMVVTRLFHDYDDEPHLAPGECYEYTLKNKSSDIVCHNYSTPSYTPGSPSPRPCFRVVGIRTPTGGYGKSVEPALTPRIRSRPSRSPRPLCTARSGGIAPLFQSNGL